MKSIFYLRIILAVLFIADLGKSNAQAPDWLWAKAMGGEISHGQGKSLAVDPATGDIYTSGYFTGSFDFDPGSGRFNLTSIGDEDIFVSKFNSMGQLIWAKALGGSAYDEGKSIVVDPSSGDIYVIGYFSGKVDFDPGIGIFNLTSTGTQAVFIFKLDSAGNFEWARAIEESVTIGDYSIAVDPASGALYTSGTFKNTVDFNPGADTFNLISDGNGDMFIFRLNSAGDFVWAIAMEGTGNSNGNAITIDPQSGFIYTTGDFFGAVDFNPGSDIFNLSLIGSRAVFISKLDSAGNFIWAKKIGGSKTSKGIAIVIDPAGNGAVYTTGEFNGTVDFDPGAGVFNLVSTEKSDVFISKLSRSGDFVWAIKMGSPEYYDYIWVTSIAFDPSGSGAVYISGHFNETIDFDPGPDAMTLSTGLNNDIYFSKLNSSGNFVWAKQIGGASSSDFSSTIAVDLGGSGAIYSTGYIGGDVDFDPGPGTFNMLLHGDQDIFVSKLSGMGNFIWAEVMSSSTGTAGLNSIAVDPSEYEGIYTTGSFSGTVDFNLGPGTFNITSVGGQDMYISKLNNSGRFLWAKSMGGTGFVYGLLIDVDPGSGDVYFTGNFEGTVDFDPGPDTFNLTAPLAYNFYGVGGMFISKLDASGNFVWAKVIGGGLNPFNTNAFVTSIAVDPSGNGDVYTTGGFYGTVDFDPGPDTFNLNSDGNTSMFISKLDSSGNFIWAKVIAGVVNSNSLALDPENGAVYTIGWFKHTIDFDPGSNSFKLSSGGNANMFISKLDTAGNFIWATSGPGDNFNVGQSIAIDPAGSGDIYIAGDFGEGVGFEDVFISKLDNSGNFIWTKAIGGEGSDYVRSLIVDPTGNKGVYAAGQFNGTVDFDPGEDIFDLNSNNGVDEMFILKLDGSGNFEWAKAVDGNNRNGTYPMAIDHSGHLYVSGSFQTPSISFGTTTLFNVDISGQTPDIFIAKLDNAVTTSVTEINKHSIHIYPNPATNEITIEFDGSEFQDFGISIYNILGEVVYSNTDQYTYPKKSIDISTLIAGIYFIEANVDGERVVKKIVKE